MEHIFRLTDRLENQIIGQHGKTYGVPCEGLFRVSYQNKGNFTHCLMDFRSNSGDHAGEVKFFTGCSRCHHTDEFDPKYGKKEAFIEAVEEWVDYMQWYMTPGRKEPKKEWT